MRSILRVGLATLAAAVIVSSANAAPILQTNTRTFENFFFLGDLHTYDYAHYIDFYTCRPDGIFGGYWIGTDENLPSHLEWSHDLPDENCFDGDAVKRAKLFIDATLVDTWNNEVKIQGIMDWDPLNKNFLDNTLYDLGGVSADFWNTGVVDVSVWAGETSLRIDAAVLMLDYECCDQGTPGSAIPEPASIALFGLGLGAVGVMRKRRNARNA